MKTVSHIFVAGRNAGFYALFLLLGVLPALASPETAWVIRTNFANPTRANVVHSMVFDPAGNLLIAGTAPSAAGGDNDYALLKYSQNGTPLWKVTYNSGSLSNDQLRGMTVDRIGNVYVTGTSHTVKYSSNGVLRWTANYAGRALAVDSNLNVFVTGFSDIDYSTVKLTAEGSNVWLRTHDVVGKPDVTQAVSLDAFGNVYVAGVQTWTFDQTGLYQRIGIIKYDTNGTSQWMSGFPSEQHNYSLVKSLLMDRYGNPILAGNLPQTPYRGFYAARLNNAGQLDWQYSTQIININDGVQAMTIGSDDALYLTGRAHYSPGAGLPPVFLTIKLSAQGSEIWRTQYLDLDYARGSAIGLDLAGNVYVTGISRFGTGNYDWATIKYNGTNGAQMWVQRYNGPANGDDQATAIAVTPSGEVFVAGHSANASGGYDIVLIKYVELPAIQWQGNQVLLQFCATNNQPCRFQATTNLTDWQDLATVAPDPNGICRYTDTNVTAHPHRFYRTVTP